jgi:polyhydroxybutyrate depolymerase
MKKRLFRLALVMIGVIIALALTAAVSFRLVNRTNGALVSSGERRTYLLYVPESYDPSVPTPLVITFHGFAQWPAHQMQLSHWNDLADEAGFIVVYPSGTRFPLRWGTGGSYRNGVNPRSDVTFISDLIDKLEREYNLDPTRIYANGMSNGGGMTFVLTCELSERIAAAGMVAGTYLYPWDECTPARQVPAIVFHGTEDPIVPFQGGNIQPFEVPFPAIPEWIDALAHRNGCAGNPRELSSTGDVSGIQYTNCTADVIFYTVAGGGHTWPGGEALPEMLTGPTTRGIDATQAMWDFFLQHPLP